MPTNPSQQAAIDRLRQENCDLQQKVDELEALADRLSTMLARYMGAMDLIERAQMDLHRSQWTPTSDGSGRDEEAGW